MHEHRKFSIPCLAQGSHRRGLVPHSDTWRSPSPSHPACGKFCGLHCRRTSLCGALHTSSRARSADLEIPSRCLPRADRSSFLSLRGRCPSPPQPRAPELSHTRDHCICLRTPESRIARRARSASPRLRGDPPVSQSRLRSVLRNGKALQRFPLPCAEVEVRDEALPFPSPEAYPPISCIWFPAVAHTGQLLPRFVVVEEFCTTSVGGCACGPRSEVAVHRVRIVDRELSGILWDKAGTRWDKNQHKQGLAGL